MDSLDLARFPDIVLKVDAALAGPVLKVDELLALRPGSVILTGRPAGDNVIVTAGQALLGKGELGCSRGKTVVRMLSFGSDT
jgi:flagellar motor switch/type III secretory pathway protein FliN